MQKYACRLALFAVALMGFGCEAPPPSDAGLQTQANALAQRYIIADGHIDVPYRMTEYVEDISARTEGGDFDFDRARAGGLNAPFMSIYIPAAYQTTGGAKAFADSLIDMVEGFVERAPDK